MKKMLTVNPSISKFQTRAIVVACKSRSRIFQRERELERGAVEWPRRTFIVSCPFACGG